VLNQLQAAADAAALAGAQKVKTDQTLARQWAHDLALANHAAADTVKLNLNTGNAANGDIVLGIYDRSTNIFTPTTTSPNAVKVVANRSAGGIDGAVPLVFGPAFGSNTVELTRYAIATAQSTTGAAMIVLDPTGSCALDIQGGPTLTVTGGNIQVNSSNSGAVCNGGSSGVAQITSPSLNIVGGTNVVTTAAPIQTGQPVIADPLASLPAPPLGILQPKPGSGGSPTINPGYYPSGITRTTNNVTLTMNPGIYVIDNAQDGFKVTGGNLVASGVMIYMKSGPLDFAGNGVFNLSPMTSGVYEGVTVFQSRTNLADSSIRGGNALSTITGSLYFPNNLVTLHGGGGTLGNQIIAFRVRLGGNAAMNVPYNGAFPVGPPKVFLVE
jgi:hypothetical protein